MANERGKLANRLDGVLLSNLTNLSIGPSGTNNADDEIPSPMSMVMVEKEGSGEEDEEGEEEPDVLVFDSDFSDVDFSDNEGVLIDEWQELSEEDPVNVADGHDSGADEEGEEERVNIPRLHRKLSGNKQAKPKVETVSASGPAPAIKIKKEPNDSFNSSDNGSTASGAPLTPEKLRRPGPVHTPVRIKTENPISPAASNVSNSTVLNIKLELADPVVPPTPPRSVRQKNKKKSKKGKLPAETANALPESSTTQTRAQKRKALRAKAAAAPAPIVEDVKVDFTNLRPIEEYFAQYRSYYTFNPENTIIGEYRRLVKALARHGLHADRSMFCGATLREFRLGTEENMLQLGLHGALAHWHVICLELGATDADMKDLKSKTKCQQVSMAL